MRRGNTFDLIRTLQIVSPARYPPYPMTMFGRAQALALSLPVRPPRYAPSSLLPAPTEDSRRRESFVECASSCCDNRIWLLIRQFPRLRKAPVSPNDDVRRPAALQQVLRSTLFLLSILLSGFSGMEIAIRVKFCFPTPKTESRPQGLTIRAGPNLKGGRFPQVASSGPHRRMRVVGRARLTQVSGRNHDVSSLRPTSVDGPL